MVSVIKYIIYIYIYIDFITRHWHEIPRVRKMDVEDVAASNAAMTFEP